ncbi:PorP/SprF family type IX secretion system membrane protein [Pontibacter litorisediminis]|uniref:PorP/SprF family type IX secretion system membrane protein n=1 Tax=Pontibacter litorisediminis TaxID=1846260 RepID=UPI0023EE2858|nr:PorP/SprF family type IX secretion system membrane protein [Pontibacter litorisediminis]
MGTGLKKIMLLCIACLCAALAMAQDVQHTQQYANRLYLNPAFAGLDHSWGVGLSHRKQWPSLNGSFITNSLSADLRLPDSKSAISLLLQQDRAGVGGLKKLQAGLGYAYHTNISDSWAMSAGLQASIARLNLDFDNLVFGDQLSDNGMVAVRSAEVNEFNPNTYIDFTVGGLLYSDQFWAGLTAAHLNQPTYNLNQETELPLRFTAIAGYKFYARSYEEQGQFFELSFTPTATFIHQQSSKKLDLGLYTKYTPLTFGIIYKGVPVVGGTNQDQSLSLLAGLQLRQFRVGFSHDVGLQGISREMGGTNEVSLVLERVDFNNLFRSRLSSKINRSIVCPAF